MTTGFYVDSGDAGNFEVLSAPADFFVEVVKGNIPGHSVFRVPGSNPFIAQGAPEDLWQGGGTFIYPTAGEQWEVLSDDSNDTALGTGAREITISFLDVNYDEQFEVIALNGTTPVLLTATDAFRTVTAIITGAGNTAGNLGGAIGTITVQVAGGGNLRHQIDIGDNRSFNSHRTVPNGKTAWLIYWLATTPKDQNIFYKFFSTQGQSGIFISSLFINVYQTDASFNPEAMVGPFVERSDIKVTGDATNNDASAGAMYQLLVVDNSP